MSATSNAGRAMIGTGPFGEVDRRRSPATAARMYDYFLGGFHNFPADQEVARAVIARPGGAHGCLPELQPGQANIRTMSQAPTSTTGGRTR